MDDWFRLTAASGTLMLAIPVAVFAGLVSFFSPCVIPLLPGYVSYATGLSAVDLAEGKARSSRGRMLAGTGLFVLGFSTYFVLIGTASGALGSFLIMHRRELSIALGVLVLGETLLMHQIIGALVIGVSLLVIDGRLFGITQTPARSG